MVGRTNVGGGTSKAFAVIGVTYPAGSVCTCSDGAKTLSLKDTGGQGFFLIPYAATWTVTATDGTKTKSESVEITNEGQSVSVELLYRAYLYNNGDECTEITGGWAATKGQLTKNTDNLYTSGNGRECGICQTQNKIDLSGYSTLYAIVTTTGSSNFSIGLTTTTSHSTGIPNSITASAVIIGAVTKEQYEVDVSAINNADNYAYIYSHAYETNVGIYLYEMWLE